MARLVFLYKYNTGARIERWGPAPSPLHRSAAQPPRLHSPPSFFIFSLYLSHSFSLSLSLSHYRRLRFPFTTAGYHAATFSLARLDLLGATSNQIGATKIFDFKELTLFVVDFTEHVGVRYRFYSTSPRAFFSKAIRSYPI